MKPLAGVVVALMLAGCTVAVPVSGLRPVDPPLRRSLLSAEPVFSEVDSVRPTLEWEPFVPPEDVSSDWAGPIRNVSYDLRVWRVDGDALGPLVYARQQLPQPFHRLEEQLLPSTRYLWTVRARFDLNGATRVTEWGSEARGARLPQIPNPFSYRFVTP